VELAKEQGAKLTAVVVIDPFPYIGLGEASAFGLQAYLSEAQAMATQSLDGVRAMAEAAGVPFMAETIERSAVFEGILDAATEQGCDLIVMGSHGRSGVKALILGSETQKVLTHSRIPVLVIKS
jgi:nucleotide-binding universal stress UspA family protein